MNKFEEYKGWIREIPHGLLPFSYAVIIAEVQHIRTCRYIVKDVPPHYVITIVDDKNNAIRALYTTKEVTLFQNDLLEVEKLTGRQHVQNPDINAE